MTKVKLVAKGKKQQQKVVNYNYVYFLFDIRVFFDLIKKRMIFPVIKNRQLVKCLSWDINVNIFVLTVNTVQQWIYSTAR